jgi:hypothetical protein
MIKYRLICKSCNISFDSWFASSNEYEKLKKRNFLNCHNCGANEVQKTLMAPKLISKNLKKDSKSELLNLNKVKNTIKKYQKFIKDNFDYVGENFAYEARSIHYNDKKNKKGVYGKASDEEIKELKEDGISTQIIPWVDDKKN